jgi:hypothetical protein
MVVTFRSIDADTGEEIISFIRRGKVVTMVRDAVTKRWIRGINGILIEVSVLMKYPPEKARRDNPLYVDIKTSAFVSGDDLPKVTDIEKELGNKGLDIINEYFGEYVRDMAYKAGSEHKAGEPENVYPKFGYYVIWHHYRDDEREDSGTADVRQVSSD